MSKSLAWLLLTLVTLVLFALLALQLGNGVAAVPPTAPPGGDAKTANAKDAAAGDAKPQPQAQTGTANDAAVDRSRGGATGPSASSTNPATQNANTK